jgi:hypothetical protein
VSIWNPFQDGAVLIAFEVVGLLEQLLIGQHLGLKDNLAETAWTSLLKYALAWWLLLLF